MTHDGMEGFSKRHFHVFVDEDEWEEFPYNKKVRLLNMIDESDSMLASAIKEPFSNALKKETAEREIDLDKTYVKYYKEQ